MKLEFQDEILRFLVQTKEAKKFLDIVENDLFDLQERQLIFDMIKAYVKKYNSLPSQTGLLEFFDKEAQKNNISSAVYKVLETVIKELYDPIETNTQQIRDELLQYYQIRLAKEFIKTFSPQVKGGDKDLFALMNREMNRISKIGESELDDEKNRGEFLLADHRVGNYSIVEGTPTYLKGLNKMTSVKGFFAPMLVILMGGPKSFKTGVMLNLSVNWVRNGLKVYYADCENGKDRIRDRARQCMLECTFEELISGELDETLSEQVRRFKVMGGDFKADFYPAHTKTMDDVDAELEYLRDEFNWVPDIICYDYLDLMKPCDRSIKEKRFMLQHVYFDAIRLQNKWNCIGLSISQVNRKAVSQKVIDMTAFSEDFGKAANCHAAFALCADDDEKEAGIIRICPVVQRDGVPYQGKNVCFVQVDAGRMTVKEIDVATAGKLLSAVKSKKPDKTTKKAATPLTKDEGGTHKRPSVLKIKNVKDE